MECPQIAFKELEVIMRHHSLMFPFPIYGPEHKPGLSLECSLAWKIPDRTSSFTSPNQFFSWFIICGGDWLVTWSPTSLMEESHHLDSLMVGHLGKHRGIQSQGRTWAGVFILYCSSQERPGKEGQLFMIGECKPSWPCGLWALELISCILKCEHWARTCGLWGNFCMSSQEWLFLTP